MATNKLMGSGPSSVGGGNDGGPSPGISGTLGNAPQAAPQQAPGPANMLSAAQAPRPSGMPMPPGAEPAPTPPPLEKLIEAAHKQGVVTAHLKLLLGKPDLKTRDILNAVGEVVADGVMSPFHAASYLSDLPSNDAEPLQLRRWVAQHYANATKALSTVSEMIAAHGQMTRRNAMMAPQSIPPQPSPGLQNALMG